MSLLSQLFAANQGASCPPSLIDQLRTAQAYALAKAALPTPQQQRIAANKKAAALRAAKYEHKYAETGLSAALLQRIPSGKENAMSRPEIRKLLGDIDYAPGGLSSALLRHVDSGELIRVGAEKNYRYYRKDA